MHTNKSLFIVCLSISLSVYMHIFSHLSFMLFFRTPLVGQTMFSVAKKTWNAAPADVKAEYGSDYFEAFQTTIVRILSVLANSNLSQVIDCLEDAITAEDPLPVYIPANLFHKILVLTLYRSLPLGMKEYLAGCIFELGGKPLSLRRKKRNNN